jgi:rhodanese-related sulfurtransferase
MKRRVLILSLSMLIVAAFVLPACGKGTPIPTEGQEVKVDGGSYRDITAAQLKAMLDNKDFLLVNVHIPYGGEIAETDIFVAYNEIEQNRSRFPDDKGAKIVVYCRSGPMSATAARTLVSLGFTNVWRLDGGFVEWERQGYELIHNESSTSQPRIYFDEDFVDVGKVPPGDSLDYTFHFKNVGNAPLIIEDTSARAIQGC